MSGREGRNSAQKSSKKKSKNSATPIVNDEEPHKDVNNDQENNLSINAQEEIQKYIQEKKQNYDNLMKFLENIDNNEEDFQNLIKTISDQKQGELQENLENFLQLITDIANNYRRDETLFTKIFQIIEYYESQIKQTFSNIERFNIFESNKKLLLFLFKKGIITIDDTINHRLLSKIEPNGNSYCHFFYPEVKKLSLLKKSF